MRKEVADLADRLGLDEDTAFPAWYAKIAFRLDDEDALDVVSYGGGNDRGVDLLHTDDEWETIVIGQSRYYKKSTRAPKPQDITYLFNTLDEIEDPQELRDAGRADLADAAEELQDARARGFAIKLVLSTRARRTKTSTASSGTSTGSTSATTSAPISFRSTSLSSPTRSTRVRSAGFPQLNSRSRTTRRSSSRTARRLGARSSRRSRGPRCERSTRTTGTDCSSRTSDSSSGPERAA